MATRDLPTNRRLDCQQCCCRERSPRLRETATLRYPHWELDHPNLQLSHTSIRALRAVSLVVNGCAAHHWGQVLTFQGKNGPPFGAFTSCQVSHLPSTSHPDK